MTEQNPNPDQDLTDDTEGHGGRWVGGKAADDVAGQGSTDDDVEGHFRRPAMDVSDDDDVEGHFRKPAMDVSDDEDDVEGHFRKPR